MGYFTLDRISWSTSLLAALAAMPSQHMYSANPNMVSCCWGSCRIVAGPCYNAGHIVVLLPEPYHASVCLIRAVQSWLGLGSWTHYRTHYKLRLLMLGHSEGKQEVIELLRLVCSMQQVSSSKLVRDTWDLLQPAKGHLYQHMAMLCTSQAAARLGANTPTTRIHASHCHSSLPSEQAHLTHT